MFRCSLNASVLNTCFLTKIELPPIFLSEVFGHGIIGDEDKISRTYIFVNDSGEKFILHDWKSTSRYFMDAAPAPTPEQFWNDGQFVELHIGGAIGSNPSQFITWLIEQYENFRYESLVRQIHKYL